MRLQRHVLGDPGYVATPISGCCSFLELSDFRSTGKVCPVNCHAADLWLARRTSFIGVAMSLNR